MKTQVSLWNLSLKLPDISNVFKNQMWKNWLRGFTGNILGAQWKTTVIDFTFKHKLNFASRTTKTEDCVLHIYKHRHNK